MHRDGTAPGKEIKHGRKILRSMLMMKQEQLHSLALIRPLKSLKHVNDGYIGVMKGHKYVVQS